MFTELSYVFACKCGEVVSIVTGGRVAIFASFDCEGFSDHLQWKVPVIYL